jgi:SecD/SecF fusion protein
MLDLPRWRVVLSILAVALGLIFTAPNFYPDGLKLPGFVPQHKLSLGLDLQGGSYLQLEVDTAALRTERLTNLTEDVRTALRDQQIQFSNLTVANGSVSVRITDPSQVNAAHNALNKLGTQLATGARDIVVAAGPDQQLFLTLPDQALAADASKAVEQSIEILRRRIDALGTKEPDIQRQGTDRIVIQVPGESDPERLKAVIGQTAKLSFQMVDDSATPQDLQTGHVLPEDMVLPSTDGFAPAYAVQRRAIVTGENLTDSQPSFDQNNRPAVSFRFNGKGGQRFGDVTSQNIGRRFAIVLDGKVISAPVIQSAIGGGSGQITGNFTVKSSSDLALLLRSGALPAKLDVVEQRTVGAELGADSVRAGALAGIIALVLIAAFMALAYGGVFGGIAIISLLVNMLLMFAALSMTGAALTLPGIAGLILTIAMAVDANVLIYERIRDEERAGRRPALAIDTGFSRATESILDANITSFISAMILFAFGAGPVRGFAWTLSIGVVTSVFSALVLTRLFIVLWFRARRPKALPICGAPKYWPLIKNLPTQTHFGFVRWAPIAAGVSALLVAGSITAFATLHLNLGTDFKGGTLIEITTPGAAPLGQLRSSLTQMGVKDPQVQGFGAANTAELRFEPNTNVPPAQAVSQIENKLSAQFPGIQFKRVDVIGPKVSGELFTGGIMALGIAIVLMLGYIWFRFQLQFGMGAVIALLHDVVLTMGVLSVFHIEFSMPSIAALLTVIGYSMNEKVIAFDRLRENLRKYKRMPLAEIINLSENERLSRTLITGSTALLALSGMLFLGGPTVFPFVFAMVFGIFVGTYSSIYVALPVILLWGVNRDVGEPEALKPINARP